MPAVTSMLPDKPADRPSIVLVHGATNSALVWTYWQQVLAEHGWASHAIDLRGHGKSAAADLSHVAMHDYADDVLAIVGQLARPPVLIGWSMGGLVAMMVAARTHAVACVGLAPSTPLREVDASITLRTGEFGPEEYGITSRDINDQPAMPDLDREERRIALDALCHESRLARDERTAGIIVESLRCPLLIVTGAADTQWPRTRYDGLPLLADHLTVDGASHWGLMLNRRALAEAVPVVLRWLTSKTE